MSTSSTSRRGRAAGKPPIAGSSGPIPPSGTGADPDAELFALCGKFAAAMQVCINVPPEVQTPDRDDVEFTAYLRARDAVIETKAQTMAGLLAKARATMADLAFYKWDGDEENPVPETACFAWSVLFDLLRLERARHDKR